MSQWIYMYMYNVYKRLVRDNNTDFGTKGIPLEYRLWMFDNVRRIRCVKIRIINDN